MAKSENKTRQTDASVNAYLATVDHQVRAADAQVLLEKFSQWTGWSPKMWGASIIGYGSYHYVYDSGREGDYLVVGFSPRKASMSIYIMPGYRDMSEKLSRLGKHKIGKSCLYINKLADVELSVLEEIVLDGVDHMKRNYEVSAG